MSLVEAGLIDLDAPIITYLPEFSVLPSPTGGNYRNITARMLLSHTAGLPMFNTGTGNMSSVGYHDEAFLNDYLITVATERMIAEEGTQVFYSNVGMELLGVLVARTAGYDNQFEGFVNYTHAFLFEPLGLNLTSYVMTDEIRAHMSGKYFNPILRRDWDDLELYNGLSPGSMYTNASEMAVLMHTILRDIKFDDGIFLRQEIFNQMFDFDSATRYQLGQNNVYFGLGFFQRTSRSGLLMIGHSGMGAGHRTEMLIHPESGIGVFVSVNADSGGMIPTILTEEILVSAVNEKIGAE